MERDGGDLDVTGKSDRREELDSGDIFGSPETERIIRRWNGLDSVLIL